MEFEKLLNFIDLENKRILKRFNQESLTKEEKILIRMAKLTEEVGELSNEVLDFSNAQRHNRLSSYDKNKLGDELADVIITTLLLAKSADVDAKKALESKIKKIDKRYE
ncbi:MazG nucleotide pyrophosphohydrolase domain-containing protein [Patescibacteria group bacterium]